MVNIGIIGVGGIANGAHIPEIVKSPDAKLFAICDCDKDKLKTVGDKYGIDEKYRFENHLDLINCPEVDAIEICTPNHLHVPFAVDAVKAGKPFNLEKPLSINYTEAEKLKVALEENNVPNMMCFSYRFKPAVRYAKELLDKGVIGDIINVKVEYFKDSAFMPGRMLEWRFIKEYAGTGVLGDLGVHLIDLAEFLMGDITSVCAKKDVVVKKRPLLDGSGEGNVETDDYCMFLADFKSGAVGVFNITRCAYGNANTIAFEIFGTKGILSVNLNTPDKITICAGEVDIECKGTHTLTVPEKYAAGQEQSFIDLCLGKKDKYLPTVEDGLKSQRRLDALLLSSEEKRWVDIQD